MKNYLLAISLCLSSCVHANEAVVVDQSEEDPRFSTMVAQVWINDWSRVSSGKSTADETRQGWLAKVEYRGIDEITRLVAFLSEGNEVKPVDEGRDRPNARIVIDLVEGGDVTHSFMTDGCVVLGSDGMQRLASSNLKKWVQNITGRDPIPCS